MTELNLLPDVKMEYIKAQNLRRMTFSISAIVAIIAVVILGFLISINQLQKKHLNDLTDDIKKESAQLKGKKDISKILTVQNQLSSLTELHSAKPAVSDLFTYLNQVTPSNVSINNLHADFTQYTFAITGSTDTLSDINKYVDTLKFTTYKSADSDKAPAFGNIVLTTFAISPTTKPGSKPATFTINLNYDPKIFDITDKIELTVPSKTTTRSMIDNPTDLFQAATPSESPTSTSGGN